MKTLSVKAWWAWALIHGQKRIENRTWRVNYRGPLAIHASVSRRGLREARQAFPELPDADGLVFGAVIGIVELIDCVPFAELVWPHVALAGDVRYISGPVCWLTANPRALGEPLACTGQLSLFEVPLSPDGTRLADSAGRHTGMMR